MLMELAGMVRRGEVDPVDLVDEAARRIAAANPTLNAVVALRLEAARREAASSPRVGALAGLPVLVKDLGRCQGMRTTMGSRLLADAPDDVADDISLARLRAQGAIVLGRTNTPEFGASSVTRNDLFGVSRNPWHTDKSPGGSSGGSAAALAAGLVPLATGSDGGGSVRIPASCCGLVGYKPTMGVIGRNEIPSWMSFASAGMMATTVADVEYEVALVAGPVGGDVLSAPSGALPAAVEQPATVLFTRSFRGYVDTRIGDALESAMTTLGKAGFAVREVASPFDLSTVVAWLAISAADLVESLDWCRDRWDELGESTQAFLAMGEAVTTREYVAAQRKRYDDAARLESMLGDATVLCVPTVNVPSWVAEGPFPTDVAGLTDGRLVGLNTPELNFTTHPAVSVPLGADDDGVPFGLQIVAPRFRDGLSFGLARVVEQLRPWPRSAPGYTPFDEAF